jgi:hypothetical protein
MIGTTLGPYRVLERLGAGGMGEVYRARDTRLHRDVAVKVLSESHDASSSRERFEREARAIAALQHPNICTIFDVGLMPDGQQYLVMELLAGETLEQRIARGTMPLPEVLETATRLADVPSLPYSLAYGTLYPVYVRGEAYLAAHRPAEARREFEKILTHRGLVGFDPIGAVARLQFARAHVAAGNLAEARRHYEGLLTLWKDADADLPVVEEARAEVKRLGSGAE